MQLRRKLEAAKREADALQKEKRDLMARLGQQGRDARAAACSQQVRVHGDHLMMATGTCHMYKSMHSSSSNSTQKGQQEHKPGEQHRHVHCAHGAVMSSITAAPSSCQQANSSWLSGLGSCCCRPPAMGGWLTERKRVLQ